MVVSLCPDLNIKNENCAANELLFFELRSRMRNNLSVIASLLRGKAAATADRQLRMALLETCECVDTIALIDEKIFVTSRDVMIEGSDYLYNLVNVLQKSYCPENVMIHVSANPVKLKPSKAELFGLLVNEVLAHTFRYSFRGREEGLVKIGLRKRNRFIEFVIEHNGTSMFYDHAKKNNMHGLGFVEILAKRLEGRPHFENDSETRFTLVFADTV